MSVRRQPDQEPATMADHADRPVPQRRPRRGARRRLAVAMLTATATAVALATAPPAMSAPPDPITSAAGPTEGPDPTWAVDAGAGGNLAVDPAGTAYVTSKTVLLRTFTVGSSRVDLQACKLEYSIVSPK